MRTHAVLAAVAALVAGATLSAQMRYRPTELGPWRPWSFTAIASARADRGATAADVQAFQARVQELGAIIKRSPAVAQPVGFAAELYGNLNGYGAVLPGMPPGKTLPLAGHLTFAAFPLVEFTRNGKLMNEDLKGGETETLPFAVNDISGSMFSESLPIEWSGHDIGAFTEPKTLGTIAGLTRIDDVLVLKGHDTPLWLPLPLNDAMAPVVAGRREILESRRDVLAKQRAEFAEWQTPAARAKRRAGWRDAAASMPDGGKDFLANMEKSDVEIETMDTARYAPGGPDERGAKDAERDLREAEAVLEKRYPEARTAPSCYDESGRTIEAKFRTVAGAPASCRPLVRTNWDYFDRALPRTSPQVLMVTMFTRCLNRDATKEVRGGCAVNRALIQSMDWTAVKGWLK